MDFYGPITPASEEGYRYILIIQDWLTKYIILEPARTASAEEVAAILTKKVISYFGPPKALITDNGTHFNNALMNELARIFNIQKYISTAYHFQSNGAIERMHHTLTEYYI